MPAAEEPAELEIDWLAEPDLVLDIQVDLNTEVRFDPLLGEEQVDQLLANAVLHDGDVAGMPDLTGAELRMEIDDDPSLDPIEELTVETTDGDPSTVEWVFDCDQAGDIDVTYALLVDGAAPFIVELTLVVSAEPAPSPTGTSTGPAVPPAEPAVAPTQEDEEEEVSEDGSDDPEEPPEPPGGSSGTDGETDPAASA
jgi:hypothetical protein